MEASFLYASSLMSNFLHNELLSTQNALSNAISVQNGGSYTYRYGQNGAGSDGNVGNYGNDPLTYMQGWWPSPFNHYSQNASQATNDVSMWEIFNSGATEGVGGLAQQIMALARNQITELDLANWIMDAYSSTLNGAGSPLEGLVGWGPGMTITGINTADLRAFMNYVGNPWDPNPYCPNPLGCNNGDIFNPGPGIYGANRTFRESLASGVDFRVYTARQWYVTPALIPFFLDIQHQQDYAWIELSFTVTNNNAYANVTTYQDLVTQLQSFEYDWQTNVMPSITNWTAQVASYQAQYANWQTQMQTALTNAQNTFNAGVQDIQSQQSAWLAQMGQLQQQATNAFQTAQSALQNGQGQGNYGQLTQQVLAALNKGQMKSNLDGELTVDLSSFKDGFGNILSGLDRDSADRGIPNFSLLDKIGSGMNRITTGISNLSLLSSTNNATMDTILGYMRGVADGMRNEKQFTQNGFNDLVEASGIHTKEVKRGDKYSGESVTYVLNDDGSIRTFTKDGKVQQMTLGDWVGERCGDNLEKCGQFTENKYQSVDVDANGKITAHRRVYNGTSSFCGSDATNSDSYCYGNDDAVVTISAPSKNIFLLGRGASRLGDVFNDKNVGFNDLVETTFQNVNAYLSSNKHTALLFNDVNNAQMRNDRNASLASQDVGNKVKIANLIVDYAESVLLGGMSTKAWVTKQSHQAVQDVMATALVHTFDLSPEVASFLAGGLVTREVARHAKDTFEAQNLGINHAVHELGKALDRTDLKFLALGNLLDSVNFGPNAEKLRAIEDWKDFKYQTYTFGIQQVAKANGMSPEAAAAISQSVVGHLRQQAAKEELGMRSGMYSLNSIGGAVRGIITTVEGYIGEIVGGLVIKGLTHVSKEMGLTSHKYEHALDKSVQERIDILKDRDKKEVIRAVDATDKAAYGAVVRDAGNKLHLDPAVVENWVKLTTEFVDRKQADRDLHHRNGFLGGKGGVIAVTWLDNTLFKGAITNLLAKVVKGVGTTVGDIGHFISPKSDSFRDSMYDQSKEWYNDMTADDLKARSRAGIIDKKYIQNQTRDFIFEEFGKALSPALGDADPHLIALLLKGHIDKQEAKKHAREQRLKDAELIIQVAAAAAIIYFTAGTGSGAAANIAAGAAEGGGAAGGASTVAATASSAASSAGAASTAATTTAATTTAAAGTATASSTSWLSSVAIQTGFTTTASAGGVSTAIATGITNGQLIALGASTAASMAIQSSLNGPGGALAALVNGVISTATLGAGSSVTGFVSYSKHQNADIIRGRDEIQGGWGGGVSLNVAKSNELAQSFVKAVGYNVGVSYNRDSGLSANASLNYAKGSVGVDYNFKTGNYTANANVDLYKSANNMHHVGLSVSASKDGHADVGGYYNYGNEKIPPQFRGHGGTLTFSNDGKFNLSGQMQGATVATVSYDTNTHKFEQTQLNYNFQNEFNQGIAAENAQKNQERAESHLVEKVLTLNSGMKDAPITKSDIEKYMPKDKDGNLTHDAQPEKLLAKWDEHKAKMAQTEKGLAAWEKDVSQAGEKAGIEVRFNEGKSATSTFGKFVKGLAGDFAMSMGFANDGNKMVDKQGVFHSDTCFVAGTQVHTSNGLKSIETIVVGDIVQSWNEKTGAFEKKRVTELFVHEVPQLFYLELDGEEELHTTWNHPFRRKVISSGDKVPPFDPRGIERKFKTHEHLLQPIGRIVSLIGSPNEPQSAVEEIPLSTKSNSGFSDVTLSKTVYSEWTKVEDLKLRDQVLKSDGSWGTVTGIYYYNVEPTQVYNLEVEDNHTYVVGEAGYVVHNYEVNLKEKILSDAEVTKAYGKKETEIKWGDKVYQKTQRDGETVFARDYDNKGTKEYIRITKDGFIEQRIKWPGQLGNVLSGVLSGEKTKYFNTHGEEVFLQPSKIVRDGGSLKLPLDPIDTRVASVAIEKVKGDFEKQLRADYAKNKKLTPEQIETRIKAEVEVYNRVADRTFKNSYVDEKGNPIKFGTSKYLETLASPEFNGQDKTVKPDGMEGPIKVSIEYLRAKYPDGKGFTPNLAPWNEKVANHKENLKNLNENLEANRNNPNLTDKAKSTFEKEMLKKIDVETKALYSVETTRRTRMEEFRKSAELIFGKNSKGEYKVSSDVIAKQTKAAICRADTNYYQSRANERIEASFGDYFINKIEMGDIRPGTEQTNGLVWDNAQLKGYEKTYPPKDDIPTSSFAASNAYTGEPLTYDYIQTITAGMKPGQMVQVWTDTDGYGDPVRVNPKPGPNHYYGFGMNEVGQFVYYNHTKERVKYYDASGEEQWLKYGEPIPKEAWPYLRVFRIYK
ncbi:TIGR04388 family protein [Leptospira yasudae]|nr:TIGR04388 family protein [Leptospira yasudae]